MLTPTDLQAIDGLIQKRTEPIAKSVSELGNEVGGLKTAVMGLQKDMKFIVDVFDRLDIQLRGRVRPS